MHAEMPFNEHCPRLLAVGGLQDKPEHPIVHSHASAHTSRDKMVMLTAAKMSLPGQQSPFSYPARYSPDCVHSPPSGPVNPATHLQSCSMLLPACEVEFWGQDMHTCEADRTSEYVPSGQRVQTSEEEIAALNFPAEQGAQEDRTEVTETFSTWPVASLILM